jgi:hypothetical protein
MSDVAGRVGENGAWYVGLSDGESLTTTFWGVWSPGVTWSTILVGDFNGDGRDDLAGRVQEIREHFVEVYKAVNWEVKGQQQLDRKMADMVSEMCGISNTLSKTGDILGRIVGEYLAAYSEGKKLVEGLQTDLAGIGTTKPGIPPAQDSRSSKDVPAQTPVTSNTGPDPKDTVPGTVNDSIISNLREYEGFGYKKDAMISMCIGGGQGISMYFTKC